jgi:hypothetical protein
MVRRAFVGHGRDLATGHVSKIYAWHFAAITDGNGLIEFLLDLTNGLGLAILRTFQCRL